MIRYALMVLSIAVVVACAVYVNGQADQPSQPQQVAVITTTAPMSASQPIPVVIGQKSKFTITLGANHTTGYSWRLAKPLNANILKNTGSVYNEPKSDLVGVPGNEVWTFQPVNKGTTTIVMEYVRPWEKDAEPAIVQTFNVTVQ